MTGLAALGSWRECDIKVSDCERAVARAIPALIKLKKSSQMADLNETDLNATGARQTALHGSAAEATRAEFGRNVFVRAVVEVSNFCRENCAYCGMRRDNRTLASLPRPP